MEHTIQFGGDQFETLSLDQKNQLMISASQFVAEKFGGWQNVLDWNAHLDETNDHAHMDMIPLTEDSRLSAKDLYSKGTLQIVQNELLTYMQELYPEMDFKRADKAERGFANGKTQKDYERLKAVVDDNKNYLQQINDFKKEMITVRAEVSPDETVSEELQKQKFGQALSDNKVTDFWKKYGTEVASVTTKYGFNQFFDWLNLSEISQKIQNAFKRTKDWINDRREVIKSEKQEMAARETEIKYGTEQLANVLDLFHPAETEKIKQLRHVNGLSGLAINGKSLTNAEALPYVLKEATIKRLKELEKSPLLNSSYRIDQNRGRGR
ncbi:plasmid recombination protein [Leuconostoc citreum]|uniref:plasmid recombination protein n=1 Tax=Leuconostoc citreum TaxID=33964 RepID=UPI0032DFFA81